MDGVKWATVRGNAVQRPLVNPDYAVLSLNSSTLMAENYAQGSFSVAPDAIDKSGFVPILQAPTTHSAAPLTYGAKGP